MIYLGQPYSSDDADVLASRYFAALEWCAKLEDRHPYSPIAHWHNVAIAHYLPKTAEYWLQHNYHMLSLAKALFALQLDGWQDSYGLAMEILFAARKGIPIAAIDIHTGQIMYVTPPTLLEEMKYGKDFTERGSNFLTINGDVE